MDQSYVKEMERLANEGRVVEVGGETYSSLGLKPVFYEPRPEAVTVRTLSGLAGYLKENRDKLKDDELLIHVADHKTAALLSTIKGKDRKRDNFMTARFDGSTFNFDSFMDSEKFIIAVNSLFLPSKGRDELLAFVSRLKIEDESGITDDGVSQTATVKVGVKGGLVEGAKAPSRVILIPFRTFSEIEQPEGEFVFRMRTQGDGVQLALFEADGGAWKSTAMELIAEWLKRETEGKVSVIY
ncbi:MAG: hypothetical protein PHS14_18620 [Elusimicrobia bacterium]|nr:hypothetical protein [Elusimicrobiota bacterium]